MTLRHPFNAETYSRQLEAIGAGESRVLILETASGAIQKGDVLDFGTAAGELTVARIVPGTKGNGVLPGFAVVEVSGPPSTLIEHEKPSAKRGK